MIKTLKWIYKLGYDKARDDVFRILEIEAEFHNSQSQIKILRDQNIKDDEFKEQAKVSARDHDQRYRAVRDIQTRLDPERYPNLDSYLEAIF